MVPPAPPRFSTMICCPSRFDSSLNTSRNITSAPVPGAIGMIARIGLVGQFTADWAAAPPHAAARRPQAPSNAANSRAMKASMRYATLLLLDARRRGELVGVQHV